MAELAGIYLTPNQAGSGIAIGIGNMPESLNEDGRWLMADGRWLMADGRWQMADGRWQMAIKRLADMKLFAWKLAKAIPPRLAMLTLEGNTSDDLIYIGESDEFGSLGLDPIKYRCSVLLNEFKKSAFNRYLTSDCLSTKRQRQRSM